MSDLIKKIDYAWLNNEPLLGLYPDKKRGYFNFRNNIILRYNREYKQNNIINMEVA